MKVCLIAPIPPYRGGIAKYCYSLAQELEKRHELLLLSYQRQYPALLFGKKSQIDPEVDRNLILKEFHHDLSYDIDSVNPVSWLRTARRIEDFNPDLVIFPWWVAYWAPMYLFLLHSLKKRGIRCLFLCINVFEHEDHPVKKFLTKFILRRVHDVIVHSEQELREIQIINSAATVRKHLLPLFEYDIKTSRRHDQTLNLLFFGFVRPYKGLDILLKAIGILKDTNILLKIVGEFWHDKAEYLSLINDLDIADNVKIIDRYIPDHEMSLYFTEADVVVLPYRKTKTSGIIATAYGFGKPVLATNVGGFHEVVQDGATGKIVVPGSSRDLADGITWFLENRQIDFAGNIASFASERMSWSSLADLIEKMTGQNER
jgi:glycosyltransferase involved in cell wall biosynthesis